MRNSFILVGVIILSLANPSILPSTIEFQATDSSGGMIETRVNIGSLLITNPSQLINYSTYGLQIIIEIEIYNSSNSTFTPIYEEMGYCGFELVSDLTIFDEYDTNCFVHTRSKQYSFNPGLNKFEFRYFDPNSLSINYENYVDKWQLVNGIHNLTIDLDPIHELDWFGLAQTLYFETLDNITVNLVASDNSSYPWDNEVGIIQNDSQEFIHTRITDLHLKLQPIHRYAKFEFSSQVEVYNPLSINVEVWYRSRCDDEVLLVERMTNFASPIFVETQIGGLCLGTVWAKEYPPGITIDAQSREVWIFNLNDTALPDGKYSIEYDIGLSSIQQHKSVLIIANETYTFSTLPKWNAILPDFRSANTTIGDSDLTSKTQDGTGDITSITRFTSVEMYVATLTGIFLYQRIFRRKQS